MSIDQITNTCRNLNRTQDQAAEELDESARAPRLQALGNTKKGGEYMTAIRKILKGKAETVGDLHRKIGGNRGYLFEICSGTRRATAPMREKIAGALGLPESELFDERGMAKFE